MEKQVDPRRNGWGFAYTNRVFAFAAERNFTFSGLIMAGYGVGLSVLTKGACTLSPGVKIVLYLLFIALCFLTLCNFVISNFLIGLGEGQKLAKEAGIPAEEVQGVVNYSYQQYPKAFIRIAQFVNELLQDEEGPDGPERDETSRWMFRSCRLYLLLLGFIMLQMLLIGATFTVMFFFAGSGS